MYASEKRYTKVICYYLIFVVVVVVDIVRITDTHAPDVVDADVDACDCTTATVRLCALEVYAGRKLLGCIGDSGPRQTGAVPVELLPPQLRCIIFDRA